MEKMTLGRAGTAAMATMAATAGSAAMATLAATAAMATKACNDGEGRGSND